ncbi:MAG: hypothetical protein EZS28_011932 [Streblomastix strix]|uniref:Uncharacterized protein n=1 Tax=Streblomastix strix TaxID=222440 RepID=A0A5J4WDX6_9EUKA|nr:MAG: hypothetical protein EZS28_011932 [Streblomastix strix]
MKTNTEEETAPKQLHRKQSAAQFIDDIRKNIKQMESMKQLRPADVLPQKEWWREDKDISDNQKKVVQRIYFKEEEKINPRQHLISNISPKSGKT